MSEELLKKLRFKSGQAAVLNAPDGYHLGIEANSEEEGQEFEFVQLFVNSKGELEQKLPQVLPMLAEDAVFWITYPKQNKKLKPDINRDSLALYVQESTPYRAVSNVAVDENWSALRFRLKEKVNSKK